MRLLVPLLLLLPACGFQPVYEQKPQALDTQDLLTLIEIEAPKSRQGDELKAALEDGFYQSLHAKPAPRYRLVTALAIDSQPFIIDTDGISSRYELTIRSNYRLLRIADRKPLKRGRLIRRVSYNVDDQDDYSTFIAQRDAISRGIQGLADDYRLRLVATLAQGLEAQ